MRNKRPLLTGSPLSSRIGQWTQPGFIKSIQRGTITVTGATSVTATVTAVRTNCSRLRLLGTVVPTAGLDDRMNHVKIVLTNSTTVTASVATSPGAGSVVVSFELVEYWPGVIKSIQSGTISVTGGTSHTATITAVKIAKSELDFLGSTTTTTGPDQNEWAHVYLTNTTTVTATVGVNSGTQVASYQVVEMY